MELWQWIITTLIAMLGLLFGSGLIVKRLTKAKDKKLVKKGYRHLLEKDYIMALECSEKAARYLKPFSKKRAIALANEGFARMALEQSDLAINRWECALEIFKQHANSENNRIRIENLNYLVAIMRNRQSNDSKTMTRMLRSCVTINNFTIRNTTYVESKIETTLLKD